MAKIIIIIVCILFYYQIQQTQGSDNENSLTLIDSVSANGDIEVLELWRSSVITWNDTCTKIKKYATDEPRCDAFLNKRLCESEIAQSHGLFFRGPILDYSLKLIQNNTCDNLTKEYYNSELYYTENAMDYASANGHIKVLEWWKNSGFILKYSESAMHMAAKAGNVCSLDWWVNSGLELKYDRNTFYKDI